MLLGVGPTPDGVIEEEGVERLHEIGEWLRRNGKAIYSTRITSHYNDGNVWFTADKDGKSMYAVYALPDGELLPATIEWTGNVPKGQVIILNTGKNARYKVENGRVTVFLNGKIKDEPIALAFASEDTLCHIKAL